MDDTGGGGRPLWGDGPPSVGRTGRPTLHLGVLVQPYGGRRAVDTADVAGFLEDKYGVMSAFARVHEKDIAAAVEGSLTGALEALMMKQVVDPWARGMSQIETAFREYISSREAERVGIPGTPTKAALRGVNHRLLHPYSGANMRRPSFRDTGLYMTSFRAWVTS